MPRPLPNRERAASRAEVQGGARSQRDRNRRTLSQNFLLPSAVRSYLSLVDELADELVLEVGAGDGAITAVLAPLCRELRAYEIDPLHARKLHERLRAQANVHVVIGDFLRAAPPQDRFVVVGNVPFSITSKVVDWCLAAGSLSTATVITQLEYARKRTAGYGRWSLRTVETWPWFEWRLRGRIPRHDFRPMPGVDAAVLHLARREEPLVSAGQRAAWSEMVQVGFGGVGGSLYRSLSRRYPPNRVAAGFRSSGIAKDTVVAFVHPDQWHAVFTSLYH